MAPKFRAGLLAGALAATTVFAAPAAAASWDAGPGLGSPAAVLAASRFDPAGQTAAWGCRWGCGWGGWGGGWGRHRGWRRNRIDGGDVLIGAAIIGGAIAIANSNNRRQRTRDVVVVERDRDFRDPDWDRNPRYRDDRRASPRGTGSSGLDNAVNICLDRIERDVRVDTVDNVERTGAGWRVGGVLFSGAPFECRIDNRGQIDGIDYGGGRFGLSDGSDGAPPRDDGQWADRRYADARAAIGGSVRPDMAVSEASAQGSRLIDTPSRQPANTTSALPAYPGGPIPGEEIPETLEEATGG